MAVGIDFGVVASIVCDVLLCILYLAIDAVDLLLMIVEIKEELLDGLVLVVGCLVDLGKYDASVVSIDIFVALREAAVEVGVLLPVEYVALELVVEAHKELVFNYEAALFGIVELL